MPGTGTAEIGLPVLLEVVLCAELGLGLGVLVGEVVLPAGAEFDVPAPETAGKRFGILVVFGPERAGFAGVRCHIA